ncbi:ABC transporter substrate-binding protein [Candidatus Korobacter versatilis]|uniref:ABC transporter substrate-binding protein n=1 Tax=Candidatus Korobacter versatilis TaxID=658062 RepID=UPI00164F2933|nr:ABC transporter substrate-binding protein [Candidatus Koribacter versatilis]
MFFLLAAALLPAQVAIRVGYFPNVTHAEALVGRANGRFEQALGSATKLEWKTFNAGPSGIEALFAGAVDLLYVGPNPAITGYIRSQGEALRVVAGGASGGASLVVRKGANIRNVEDFRGKKVASPQLGNTQDVALRAWLLQNHLKSTDKGGDVQIVPLANPDQLTLFQKGQLDASWAPEPWAARLIQEADGQIFLDERSLWPDHRFAVTEVVVRTAFLREHPDLVKKWLSVHVELANWINKNPGEAKAIVNRQIQSDTGRALPSRVLDEAFSRLEITYDPIRSSLTVVAERAYQAGFLKQRPDLSRLYSFELLNQVLREKNLPNVE